MTPALLREAGEALYGPLWQSELARAVGVADRTVRRWLASQRPVPASLRETLREMLTERGKAVAAVRRKLPR